MRAKSKLFVVLAGLLALAAWFWWSGSVRVADGVEVGAHASEESAAPGAAPAAPESSLLAGEVTPERRELPVPASTPEPAPPAALALQHGRVRDTAGRPVAGIAVYRGPRSGAAPTGEPLAVTDLSGEFTWTLLPYWEELTAESDLLTTVLPALGMGGASVIVVAPRERYSGIVVDERGVALAGAELAVEMAASVARALLPGEARIDARRWTTTSAADGTFVLDRVGWTDGLAVEVRLNGFEPAREVLPEHSSAALVLELRRPTADANAIAGRVVDANGVAVEGASVAFEHGTEVTSDAEGRFVAPIPAGATHGVLWAVKSGHLPARREIADLAPKSLGPAAGSDELASGAQPASDGELTSGGGLRSDGNLTLGGARTSGADAPAREPITLVLGGEPPTIAGVVLDREGEPVERAHVFTWDLTRWPETGYVEGRLTTEWFPGRTTTDAEGRFRINGLLAKPYTLRALHPRTLEVAERLDVEAGAQSVVLQFTGSEAVRRVAGRVVDCGGQPVARVMIFCGRLSSPGVERLRSPLVTGGTPVTDDAGEFEFPALCVDGTFLLPAGGDLANQDRVPLSTAMDLEHLVLTVSRKCSFQVLLESDPNEADAFHVLDADGQVLPLGYDLGNSSVVSSGGLDLAGGRSEVVYGDERARTLVLSKARAEVRRVPIRLIPGELQLLRL